MYKLGFLQISRIRRRNVKPIQGVSIIEVKVWQGIFYHKLYQAIITHDNRMIINDRQKVLANYGLNSQIDFGKRYDVKSGLERLKQLINKTK